LIMPLELLVYLTAQSALNRKLSQGMLMSRTLEQLQFTFLELTGSLPLFAAALMILWAGKFIYNCTTSFCFHEELTEKDNSAFGTALSGYLVGLAIALTGAITSSIGTSIEEGLINVAFSGVLAIILMRLSLIINDKLILHKFNIYKEMIEDRNSGTGFVVAGSSIATGLMLAGVLTGESEGYAGAVTDTLIYWAAGQLILVIGAAIFSKACGYDIHKVIEEDDNVPAGISFCGFLIALGIISYASLKGASVHWQTELLLTAVASTFGIFLLICSSIVCDKVLLPKSQLVKEIVVDKNIASGAVSLAVFLAVGTALASVINTSI